MSSAKLHYSYQASEKDQQKFAHLLSEDEKMVILTGLSHVYLRQRFVLYWALYTLILLVLFFAVAYFANLEFFYLYIASIVLAILLAAMKTYFLKEGIQYILTNKRLLVQIGYFSITLYSAPYDKITYVGVEQGFSERLFLKYGKVVVHTAGIESKEIKLEHVNYPMEFKNTLERLINHQRQTNA